MGGSSITEPWVLSVLYSSYIWCLCYTHTHSLTRPIGWWVMYLHSPPSWRRPTQRGATSRKMEPHSKRQVGLPLISLFTPANIHCPSCVTLFVHILTQPSFTFVSNQHSCIYIFLIFLSLPIIRYLGYPSSSQSSYNLVQCTWLYWYYFSPLSFHRTILLSVISLLNEPNTFSAANVDASVMYRKWRDSRGKDKQYIELIKYVGYTRTV